MKNSIVGGLAAFFLRSHTWCFWESVDDHLHWGLSSAENLLVLYPLEQVLTTERIVVVSAVAHGYNIPLLFLVCNSCFQPWRQPAPTTLSLVLQDRASYAFLSYFPKKPFFESCIAKSLGKCSQTYGLDEQGADLIGIRSAQDGSEQEDRKRRLTDFWARLQIGLPTRCCRSQPVCPAENRQLARHPYPTLLVACIGVTLIQSIRPDDRDHHHHHLKVLRQRVRQGSRVRLCQGCSSTRSATAAAIASALHIARSFANTWLGERPNSIVLIADLEGTVIELLLAEKGLEGSKEKSRPCSDERRWLNPWPTFCRRREDVRGERFSARPWFGRFASPVDTPFLWTFEPLLFDVGDGNHTGDRQGAPGEATDSGIR